MFAHRSKTTAKSISRVKPGCSGAAVGWILTAILCFFNSLSQKKKYDDSKTEQKYSTQKRD
jgi:hypothetical protein